VDKSRHAAEAILQSAVTSISELKLQLRDAGVFLRQGSSRRSAAWQLGIRRGRLGALREVSRRLEQEQAEALLLPFRLQGGNCAAELEVLELETAEVLRVRAGSGDRLAGLLPLRGAGVRGGAAGRLRWGRPARKSSSGAGVEASDHLTLEGGLIPRLPQGTSGQVRHGPGVGRVREECSWDGAAGSEALAIGEGEHGGAVVGSDPRCGNSAAFPVRELGDSVGFQHRADEEQLCLSTSVLLLDTVSLIETGCAFVREFEEAKVRGWHAPRDGESRRKAARPSGDEPSEAKERLGSEELIHTSSTWSRKRATSPWKFLREGR
jgi:hypothetical protein